MSFSFLGNFPQKIFADRIARKTIINKKAFTSLILIKANIKALFRVSIENTGN